MITRNKKEKKNHKRWFKLKQAIGNIIYADLCEEWDTGIIPNIEQKIGEINYEIFNIIEDAFIYLKELGKIEIVIHPEHDLEMVINRKYMDSINYSDFKTSE